MIRRLAVIAATLGLLAISSPAHAVTPKTSCYTSPDGDAHVCLDVYWHALPGGGLEVDDVYLRVTGGFWETKAFDCDHVRLWNDNEVVQWRKDDAACDIYKSPGYTLFHPNESMPNTAWARVSLAGWPKLDKAPDPGRILVGVTVP